MTKAPLSARPFVFVLDDPATRVAAIATDLGDVLIGRILAMIAAILLVPAD
jgi:hypothetical protein